jgi:cytosine/adenosine deaminase-related metal-dependent hydrolase
MVLPKKLGYEMLQRYHRNLSSGCYPNGAKTLVIRDEIGSLEPGKKVDVITIP